MRASSLAGSGIPRDFQYGAGARKCCGLSPLSCVRNLLRPEPTFAHNPVTPYKKNVVVSFFGTAMFCSFT